MITVSEVAQQLIKASPFISEALADGLINVSALARQLQPNIQKVLGKDVKKGAIVMAINRMTFGDLSFVEKDLAAFFSQLTDISVRSNLVDYTFRNSTNLLDLQLELVTLLRQNKRTFYTFSQSISETTIIVQDEFETKVDQLFTNEQLLAKEKSLSAITLLLPEENRSIYGVYYFILKELAWNGINIVEIISTANEFTLIFHDEDLDQAFSILMRLRNS